MSPFVLLPLSISILLLLGFAVSNVWHEPGGGLFGVLFVVGLLVYLGVVTVKLAWFRPGALQLAVCLLALEVVGAVLYVGGAGARASTLETSPPSPSTRSPENPCRSRCAARWESKSFS